MTINSFQDAKIMLLTGDLTCEPYFEQNNNSLELGYCKLLAGKIEEAKELFNSICDNDFRADWALKLIQFIEMYVTVAPSYFQIRNFLEIDLHLLIQSGQAQFVENIINGSDTFYSINPESYKFIARVMLYNGYKDLAFYFLKKAKDKFYYDPEMHFMMAICYEKSDDIPNAKKSLRACLSILSEYFPAKIMLDQLENIK